MYIVFIIITLFKLSFNMPCMCVTSDEIKDQE